MIRKYYPIGMKCWQKTVAPPLEEYLFVKSQFLEILIYKFVNYWF